MLQENRYLRLHSALSMPQIGHIIMPTLAHMLNSED